MAKSITPIRLLGRNYFIPGRAAARASLGTVNGTIPLHDRDFMEIALVLSGSATHQTIYGKQEVSRGDLFVLRPGGWHRYLDAHDLELCECRFAMELLQRELAWTRDDPGMELLFWAAPISVDRRGVMHLRLKGEALNRAEQMMRELAELTDPASPGDRSQEIGRLLLLLAHLGHEVTASLQVIRKGKPEPHQAVTEGIRMMEQQIRRDWTLPDLAKRLKVEKSYLIRLFRTHTGAPPMQFLAQIRAERAALLLLRTRRDISVIGRQVGWDDPNYFARRFKAHFGLSATRYRTQFESSNDGD